jgi:hypothetical protein
MLIFFLSSDNSDNIFLQNFITLYKPKAYINEKINQPIDKSINKNKYNFYENYIKHYNISSHFLNKIRIFNLLENYIKENDIEYKIVISLNLEIFFNEKLVFENIQDNTIYIPYGIDWYGLNDNFAYGNLSSMKKYMNISLNNKNNCCCNSNQICLMLVNIDFYNLNIIRFKLNYKIDK